MKTDRISPVSSGARLLTAWHEVSHGVRAIERGMRRFVRCAIVVTLLSSSAWLEASHLQDRGASIEEVAAEVARLTNRNSRNMLDDSVLSTSARAKGRNVIFEYVVEPPPQLKEHTQNMQTLMTRATCLLNQDNEAFRRGLFYTFPRWTVILQVVSLSNLM